MARVLVTGSSDGLGLMAARLLGADGHEVVLHARSTARADEARSAVPGAEAVVVGDLADLGEVRALATSVDRIGPLDAVIHNAGIGYRRAHREVSADGHELHLAVNVFAPYVLSALMARPGRLVWLSSGMHRSGTGDLGDLEWERRRWNGTQAYSDSKLHDVLLAFAFARHWPDVPSNAVEPGWVATKMGGPSAPDDLQAGAATQAWLAVDEGEAATATAGYWYHQRPADCHPAARDEDLQERLLDACAALTGVAPPWR